MHNFLSLDKYLLLVEEHFEIHKVCALIGPRQCGKTTLAKQFQKLRKIPEINYFDLEDPLDLSRLDEPMLTLSNLTGYVIIDEVQRKRDIFSVLRVLVDRKDINFLVLGSASGVLLRQSSESLAGRIGYIEMTPFYMAQVQQINKLWIRGGFPKSYLSSNDKRSTQWRKDYIKTFLERDIPTLGIKISPMQIRKFWLMLCHYHGGIFNASEIGKSMGISYHTVQNYLGILNDTFMIRVLQPWYENLNKRQVKAPKIYFRDSGIYHNLMGINSQEQLSLNPKLGASWEGFAMEQIINYYDAEPEECYFWSSHGQAEIDLLIFKNGEKWGFEFKYTDTPRITNSISTALNDLKLDGVKIIFPGKTRFFLSSQIEVIGLDLLAAQSYQYVSIKNMYLLIAKEGSVIPQELLSIYKSIFVDSSKSSNIKEQFSNIVKNITDQGIKAYSFDLEGINSHVYSLGMYQSGQLMHLLKNNTIEQNLFGGDFILHLITTEKFKELKINQIPQKGDIIIYFDNNDHPVHSGIITDNALVTSKWGLIPAIFEHKIQEVPESYLTKPTSAKYLLFRFYQKIELDQLEEAVKDYLLIQD